LAACSKNHALRPLRNAWFFLSAQCVAANGIAIEQAPESIYAHCGRVPTTNQRGNHMNKLTWIGTIVWGIIVTGFGLNGAGADAGEVQPQDVMLLLAGGMVTCMIGVIGLSGFMGWIPGMRTEQKSYS
jgi:hypothetical protein